MANFPRTKIARNPVWLYPPPEDCSYTWNPLNTSPKNTPIQWQIKPFAKKMEWLQAQRGNLYQVAYRRSNGWKYTLGEAYFLIDVKPGKAKWLFDAEPVLFEYLGMSGIEKGKPLWFECDVNHLMIHPWLLVSKANDSEK